MFEPYTQMNPWTSGLYGTVQPYGLNAQTFFPTPLGFGFGAPTPFFGVPGIPGFQGITPYGQAGFTPQLAPQAWYGNPVGTVHGQFNPITQQAVQQIPQLLQNASLIAQQVPQLIQQIPQIIQQNPQLVQQAPQLQQIPPLLQQAAVLAQQVPHVLQALCTSPFTQSGTYGGTPWGGTIGGFRPFA